MYLNRNSSNFKLKTCVSVLTHRVERVKLLRFQIIGPEESVGLVKKKLDVRSILSSECFIIITASSLTKPG